MGALEAAEPGQVQPKKKKVDEVKVSNKIWTLVGWFLPFSDAVLATDQLQVNLFPRHLLPHYGDGMYVTSAAD